MLFFRFTHKDAMITIFLLATSRIRGGHEGSEKAASNIIGT
jgi:hypothetical protein